MADATLLALIVLQKPQSPEKTAGFEQIDHGPGNDIAREALDDDTVGAASWIGFARIGLSHLQ